MCGRYKIEATPEILRAFFHFEEHPNFPPRFNIAPTQPVPIVRLIAGKRHFQLVRWGLVPSWMKEMPKSVLINARAETINEKPSFKGGFRHRRCLIPTDGFYEWQAREGRVKQPHMIHQPDGAPFAMAGIWDDWMSADGSELETCAIVTTAANDRLKPVHHRMPVILDPKDWDAWLDTDGTSAKEAAELLRSAPDDLLEALPVSPRVNKISHDDAELTKIVDPDADLEDADERQPKKKGDDQFSLL
jgi:putative SOS response-associated peptidase YedK